MKKYLYFTVFISGMTTLAVELSASRLLGSVFGTSNLVWAAIIGLILIYLTLGYYLGGRIADKFPTYKTMFGILAWGAFFVGVVPYLARPVLKMAADAFDGLQLGILLGAFVVVLILFSIPITLLGMVSPFAIRLSIVDARYAGNISGRIYAISTLGSFLGTFLPVLLLIPNIGTANTFLFFSLLLLLISIIGLWRATNIRKIIPLIFMALVIILLAVTVGNSSIKETIGQIHEKESAYNYIQVLKRDGYLLLRLNEGQGVHSIYKPDEFNFGGPWQQFLVAPFFEIGVDPADIKEMAIIGLAAGTIARQAAKVFPNIEIDGFELDPEIVKIGKEYFGMNLQNLNIFVEDGRTGLSRTKNLYDVVGVDAYQPPYIPWHMTTQEFFQVIYDHLKIKGSMVINVGRAPEDRRLIEGLFSTISSVFPSVYVMDVPGSFNSIIYATKNITEANNLNTNMIKFSTNPGIDPLLTTSMYLTWLNLQETPRSEVIYTDDLAPIEWITNNMVLKYILLGDLENNQ